MRESKPRITEITFEIRRDPLPSSDSMCAGISFLAGKQNWLENESQVRPKKTQL